MNCPMSNRLRYSLIASDENNENDQKQTILKLHKQFAHPSSQRLVTLLQDAGKCDENTKSLVDEISKQCEVCKKYKKTPARPVRCIPLVTEFNKVVAMDLKQWKRGIYFLHLIDLATIFSLAAIIYDKKPSTIIEKVMTLWIGSGMGPTWLTMVDSLQHRHGRKFEHKSIEFCCFQSMAKWYL